MSEIIREISASTAIRFGTTEPYAMGRSVKMRSIGFADLRMAELTVTAPAGSLSALTPMMRQRLYSTLEANGIPNEAVAFTPSVATGRTVMFVDGNPASKSHGKNKRGVAYTYHFEFTDPAWFNRGQTMRIPAAE
jgi:hypothetical protein